MRICCDGIYHLTVGIKVTDPQAIDPRDGSPLCLNNVENYGRIFNNKSQNYCFAMQSLIGKDTKSTYQEFVDFFNFFENAKRLGLPASEQGSRIMPMDFGAPRIYVVFGSALILVVAHGKMEMHIFATCAHAVEIQSFFFSWR